MELRPNEIGQLSLFRRITRYPVFRDIDPRENRLTEAFAATLERVPELARELLGGFVEDPATVANSISVSTQRPTRSGKVVDLEIAFGGVARTDVLFWIEIKHGSGLGETQIDDYRADLAEEPAKQKMLLLLVPAGYTGRALPSDVEIWRWEQVSASLSSWLEASASDDRQTWLAREFDRFLEEEGMKEKALGSANADALMRGPETEEILANLCAKADSQVEAAWSPRIGPRRPEYGAYGEFVEYDKREGGKGDKAVWRDASFKWGVWDDGAQLVRRGEYILWAGADLQRRNPADRPENEEWLAALVASGITFLKDSDDWGLFRILRFGELVEPALTPATLDQQVQRVSSFVVETFRTLASNPPPP